MEKPRLIDRASVVIEIFPGEASNIHRIGCLCRFGNSRFKVHEDFHFGKRSHVSIKIELRLRCDFASSAESVDKALGILDAHKEPIPLVDGECYRLLEINGGACCVRFSRCIIGVGQRNLPPERESK